MRKIFLILVVIFFSVGLVFAEELSETQKLKEQGIALYNQNDVDAAFRCLSNIPNKEKDAEVYLLLANIMQDTYKPLVAVTYLQKAITLDPKNYKSYYNLGNLYLEDNKLNSAISMYKQSVKYNSKFAYAYYNLGNCYYELLDYKNARKYFVKALIAKPTEPDFYYNLSLTYTKMNNEKKEKKAMETYLKLKNELY